MKYLGINLTATTKKLYSKNNKILQKDTENTELLGIQSCNRMGRPIISNI